VTTRGYRRPDVDWDDMGYAILSLDPASTLWLSVQADANIDHSIVRASPIPGTAFCGEYLIDISGAMRTGNRIREETWTIARHLAQARGARPGIEEQSLGFVGAGNLTMNPQYVAFSDGELYCVRGQRFDREFSCLMLGGTGATLRRLRLDPHAVPAGSGIAGPALVRDGEGIHQDDLLKMAGKGEFYDLRHIIQFPMIFWPEEGSLRLQIDVGLERFWENGELRKDVIESALRGEPIDVDLSPYTAIAPRFGRAVGLPALRAALATQGYRGVRRPRDAGDVCIGEQELHICFYPGIYNHSLLGVRRDGAIVWLGIRGLGNRAGLTMVDAAALAARHMRDGILVDNGGDVMCRYGERWIIESSYGRDRIRALVFFTPSRPPRPEVRRLPSVPLGAAQP